MHRSTRWNRDQGLRGNQPRNSGRCPPTDATRSMLMPMSMAPQYGGPPTVRFEDEEEQFCYDESLMAPPLPPPRQPSHNREPKMRGASYHGVPSYIPPPRSAGPVSRGTPRQISTTPCRRRDNNLENNDNITNFIDNSPDLFMQSSQMNDVQRGDDIVEEGDMFESPDFNFNNNNFCQPPAGNFSAAGNASTSGMQMRQLENKQKAMECSMRRLLRSMRELRVNEQSSGCTVELDRRRRLKLTRMIQILMLQRRNMQLQNDTLRKEVMTLTRKFMGLRKRAERLVVENIDMRKYYSETKGDNDRKSLQIENLIQGKSIMEKEVQDKMDLKVEVENLKFEIRRLLVENHNLKQSLQTSDQTLMGKVKQKESLELENSELRAKLIKLETQEANLRVRFERIAFQNNALSKEVEKNQNNRCNAEMLTQEYDQLRERHEELLRNYDRLEHLYVNESEQRKSYHNQLQEVRGNIRVLCRCKPCADNQAFEWVFKSTDKIMVPSSCMQLLSKGDNGCYSFNRVFRPVHNNQQDIFEDVKPLLSSCVDGYNVCILAYGPTGSGKTFTMQGTREEPGITLRAISELSEMCAAIRGTWNITTRICMLEIYNDVIYDLLDKHIQPVRLSDDGTDVRIMDAEEKVAKTEQDILYWIAKGHKRRKVAETKMNMQSSRSHLIIKIQLVMESVMDETAIRTSTLIFCDLAGSENAEYIHATGRLKVETGYINKSLVTLGRVLEGLKSQSGIIPYRDSKLTHLLKPCLSGNAKCVLIIAVAADKGRVDRTLNALQFGARAMQVALGKPRPNTRLIQNKITPPGIMSQGSKQLRSRTFSEPRQNGTIYPKWTH